MKILIDITHPANVHLFKNFIWQMEKKGHKILIVARDKDVILKLLKAYGFEYISLSKAMKMHNLFFEFIIRFFKLYKIARKFKPDVMMAVGGHVIMPLGKLLGIPAIALTSCEIDKVTNMLFPLATAVCVPSSFEGKIRKNFVRYNSYQELFYLHPKYFKPEKLNIEKPYFLARFIGWQAVHDYKQKGIRDELDFVKTLEKFGKVIVTSETEIPKLKKYKAKFPPEKAHSVLKNASLAVGESVTMLCEAAILGTPTIYISTAPRGNIHQLRDRYGLILTFPNQKAAMPIIKKFVKNYAKLKKEWKKKREKMLKEKINPTEWFINFIEKLIKESKN